MKLLYVPSFRILTCSIILLFILGCFSSESSNNIDDIDNVLKLIDNDMIDIHAYKINYEILNILDYVVAGEDNTCDFNGCKLSEPIYAQYLTDESTTIKTLTQFCNKSLKSENFNYWDYEQYQYILISGCNYIKSIQLQDIAKNSSSIFLYITYPYNLDTSTCGTLGASNNQSFYLIRLKNYNLPVIVKTYSYTIYCE